MILITCLGGLVEYVRREAEELGSGAGDSHKTGLELQGDQYDAMRLNLHLRTEYNVLFLLGKFKRKPPAQCYAGKKYRS